MIRHLNKYGESLKEDVPIQNLLEFVFLYERNIEGLMEYAKECSVNPLEKVFEWLNDGRLQYIKNFGFVMYF